MTWDFRWVPFFDVSLKDSFNFGQTFPRRIGPYSFLQKCSPVCILYLVINFTSACLVCSSRAKWSHWSLDWMCDLRRSKLWQLLNEHCNYESLMAAWHTQFIWFSPWASSVGRYRMGPYNAIWKCMEPWWWYSYANVIALYRWQLLCIIAL